MTEKEKQIKNDFIHSDLYIESPELDNPYVGLERRPKDVDAQDNEWKNRHRISAKLTANNYRKGWKYMKNNDCGWSTCINHLLATHPETQQN
tara:strand:- start:234 stop:509 length:276 start_codon:yes stop_codon:yes gene_type:complete